MSHEVDVLVGGSEMAERCVKGANGTSLDAPGQRQDLAARPVVAMPELQSEQLASILSQVAEQVKLLLEGPWAGQVPGRRMGVVGDQDGEDPGDWMAREPGPDEFPVSGPAVGRVAGGVHADESKLAAAAPALDNRALIRGPAGLADGEEHQQPGPLEVRDGQRRHLGNVTEVQAVELGDLRGRGPRGRQAVVGAGQAGRAGRIPVGRDIGDEYELAHEGITATTLISTRMFFSAAPVVA